MRTEVLDIVPEIKISEDDFEIEFGMEIGAQVASNQALTDEIRTGLNEVNEQLRVNDARVDELNKEIHRLTNHADGFDYMVAVGSGVLAAMVDVLWVGDFQFERGKAWSNKTVNDFVMKVAKSKGYTGDRLDGAIQSLEDKFKIPSDNIWKGENVGISARSHHIDDLAHHPTPLGLFFSILTQFTHKGYFQNSEGHFLPITIDEKAEKLIGHTIPSKIMAGTLNWFFHLVSDMSGSNKTAGAGMGIPGPIVSMIKEMSVIPGLNKTDLPKKVKEIFEKEKFDLRSELAVGHELGRQAVPVILNEVIVRAFYFLRRLTVELKEKKSLKNVDWKVTLPFKNRTIVRMLTIATGTFTLIDLSDAAIRGALKSGGNWAVFAKEFILRVNFVGVGRFAIAIGTDATMGMKQGKVRNEKMMLLSKQLNLMNAKVFYLQSDMWLTAQTTGEVINEVIGKVEETTKLFIESQHANQQSLTVIGESLADVDDHNPGLVNELSDILKWG